MYSEKKNYLVYSEPKIWVKKMDVALRENVSSALALRLARLGESMTMPPVFYDIFAFITLKLLLLTKVIKIITSKVDASTDVF